MNHFKMTVTGKNAKGFLDAFSGASDVASIGRGTEFEIIEESEDRYVATGDVYNTLTDTFVASPVYLRKSQDAGILFNAPSVPIVTIGEAAFNIFDVEFDMICEETGERVFREGEFFGCADE